MHAQLTLTSKDLLAIRDGIIAMSTNRESGNAFEYCYNDGDFSLIMDITYTYETRQVIGGSYENYDFDKPSL
jgi:hypothetical protein